jgi:BTB/POZ domain
MNDESTREQRGNTTPVGPPNKKLRLSDPDLKIVVGEGEQQKTYQCYSQIMAMHSGYIDIALALPMLEHETSTLTFPDIDPHVWDKMMSYLHQGAVDPEYVKDVSVVLPWYDKYDFEFGLELCHRMLGQVISRPFLVGSNLDESTAAMELLYLYAHRMTPSTRQKATTFLLEVLQSGWEGRHSFEHWHICQLVPALRANDGAWSYTTETILHGFPVDGDREKYVDSLAFPDLILSCIQAHLNQRKSASRLAQTLLEAKSMETELLSLIPRLRVQASTDGLAGLPDGLYHRASKYKYWMNQKFSTKRIEFDAVSGWTIKYKDGDHQWLTLYVCSERPINQVLPPKTGWRLAVETGQPLAAPVLNYIMKKR